MFSQLSNAEYPGVYVVAKLLPEKVSDLSSKGVNTTPEKRVYGAIVFRGADGSLG